MSKLLDSVLDIAIAAVIMLAAGACVLTLMYLMALRALVQS
jgi:hypothetical protein